LHTSTHVPQVQLCCTGAFTLRRCTHVAQVQPYCSEARTHTHNHSGGCGKNVAAWPMQLYGVANDTHTYTYTYTLSHTHTRTHTYTHSHSGEGFMTVAA